MTNFAIHTKVVPSSDSCTQSGGISDEISSGNIEMKKNFKISAKKKETKGNDKNTVIKEKEGNSKCEIQTIKERKRNLEYS